MDARMKSLSSKVTKEKHKRLQRSHSNTKIFYGNENEYHEVLLPYTRKLRKRN